MSAETPVVILYTNWRGETRVRKILIQPYDKSIWFGKTEHHPEPQWLLTAIDPDIKDENRSRDFAMKGIKAWGQENINTYLELKEEN